MGLFAVLSRAHAQSFSPDVEVTRACSFAFGRDGEIYYVWNDELGRIEPGGTGHTIGSLEHADLHVDTGHDKYMWTGDGNCQYDYRIVVSPDGGSIAVVEGRTGDAGKLFLFQVGRETPLVSASCVGAPDDTPVGFSSSSATLFALTCDDGLLALDARAGQALGRWDLSRPAHRNGETAYAWIGTIQQAPPPLDLAEGHLHADRTVVSKWPFLAPRWEAPLEPRLSELHTGERYRVEKQSSVGHLSGVAGAETLVWDDVPNRRSSARHIDGFGIPGCAAETAEPCDLFYRPEFTEAWYRVSPDGRWLLLIGEIGRRGAPKAVLYSLVDRCEVPSPFSRAWGWRAEWSPDGRYLGIIDREQVLRISEIERELPFLAITSAYLAASDGSPAEAVASTQPSWVDVAVENPGRGHAYSVVTTLSMTAADGSPHVLAQEYTASIAHGTTHDLLLPISIPLGTPAGDHRVTVAVEAAGQIAAHPRVFDIRLDAAYAASISIEGTPFVADGGERIRLMGCLDPEADASDSTGYIETIGNNDGHIGNMEAVALVATLRSAGESDVGPVLARVSTADREVNLLQGGMLVERIRPGGEQRACFLVGTSRHYAATELELTLDIAALDDVNVLSSGTVTLPVKKQLPSYEVDWSLYDGDEPGTVGNGDHRLEPGEYAEIAYTLANVGELEARDIQLELEIDDECLAVVETEHAYKRLHVGDEVHGSFVVSASPYCGSLDGAIDIVVEDDFTPLFAAESEANRKTLEASLIEVQGKIEAEETRLAEVVRVRRGIAEDAWIAEQDPYVSVSFEFCTEAKTRKVHLVGSFNDWGGLWDRRKVDDEAAMEFLGDGCWTSTVTMLENSLYNFAFLVNGRTWATDPSRETKRRAPMATKPNEEYRRKYPPEDDVRYCKGFSPSRVVPPLPEDRVPGLIAQDTQTLQTLRAEETSIREKLGNLSMTTEWPAAARFEIQ